MGKHYERGRVLFSQKRYELAEQEFRRELVDNPNEPLAHALLALCLSERKHYPEATSEAEQAIVLAPELALGHYALATILYDRAFAEPFAHRTLCHLERAERVVQEAIRLDPEDANGFCLLGRILYSFGRYRLCLEMARRGLALDAENDGCANLQALALVQLGRGQEAETTLQKALTRDPENAVTHANRGWVLLGQATPPAALEHFREALRLDPNLLPARGGLLVALKARSRLYRPFLRYYLLISGLSAGSLHTLVACSLFLFLGLNLYARENPERGAWAWVVQVFVLAFALTTWVADPLFNLKLLRDHFGRLVLSRNQVVVSRVHLAAAGLLTLALGVTGWPGMGLEKVFGCVACVVLIASLETTPQGYGERS